MCRGDRRAWPPDDPYRTDSLSRVYVDGIEGMSSQELGWEVPGWTSPEVPAHEVLTGQYVKLEPMSVDRHASALWDGFSDSEPSQVWDYLPYGPFVSLSQFHKLIRELCGKSDIQFYAIRDVSTGKLGGFLSYLNVKPDAGSIEVGYITLAPHLQRTRCATEAIVLMARRAFALGYRRFEWKCNALNRRSRAAAQRYGFSYEGVFRQAAVIKGRNRDTAWFAMVDSDFEGLDAAYTRWLDPQNFVTSGAQIHALGALTAPILVNRDPMLG